MSVIQIVFADYFKMLLIFCRIAGVFMVIPGFATVSMPPKFKVLCVMAISFCLSPLIPVPENLSITQTNQLPLLCVQELFWGIFIGLGPRLLFYALDFCGQMISFQMSLASASVFNPAVGAQSSIPSHLLETTGMVLLLQPTVIVIILKSLLSSYDLFPLFQPLSFFIADMNQSIVAFMGHFFKIGLQLSIPFLLVGLLMQVGFGVINKIVPQMQIFFVSMPLQILIGLFLLSMTFGNMMGLFFDDFEKNAFIKALE